MNHCLGSIKVESVDKILHSNPCLGSVAILILVWGVSINKVESVDKILHSDPCVDSVDILILV